MFSNPLSLRKFVTLLIFSLSCIGVPAGAAAEDDEIAQVVFHADFSDPRRFSAMLTSINNMVTHYQDELIDYDVRIVFVAHGVRFLTGNKLEKTPFQSDAALEERRENLAGRLSSLRDVQNVKLELCDITRSQIDLNKKELYSGVELVPSGVVRITELQQRGFAYIKIE